MPCARPLLHASGLILCGLALLLLSACRTTPPPVYDLVIAGGRVMDPATYADAVLNVGISGGSVAAISARPLRGREIIDATGLVVAPGFIDLHTHGQDLETNRLQAMDGVTTALDLEAGVFPVAQWYRSRQGQMITNYGASVSHMAARVYLKYGLKAGHLPTSELARAQPQQARGAWAYEPADDTEIAELQEFMRQGLEEGGLGLGFGLQYTPGATRTEIFRMFEVAAEAGVPCFVHVRSAGHQEPGGSVEAIEEVLAHAVASGAPLHIVHIASSCLSQVGLCMKMIGGAAENGLDVSTEVYPYTAASTDIGSAIFDEGWRERMRIDYGDLQWVETGERLNEESFRRYRDQGGWVIIHSIPDEAVDFAVTHPLVMIASDGMPFIDGMAHPRGAGTFSRVLGLYSRERELLPLMNALAKMTIMPARRMEEWAPMMRRKGRIAVGADADITIFDAERIIDRATFADPDQPSEGIEYVLVGGTPVVRDGRLVEDVYPGRPVHRLFQQ